MNTRKILSGLAPLALLLPFGTTVHAEERTQSLSLSPAEVAARGSFGQSVAVTFTMTNATDATRSFEPGAQDIVVRGGRRVFIPPGAEPPGIAATAVFSRDPLTIDPPPARSLPPPFPLPPRPHIPALLATFPPTAI